MLRVACAVALACARVAATRPTDAPCRSVLAQPFASTSIWNTPIGRGAVLRALFPDGLDAEEEEEEDERPTLRGGPR